MKDRYRKNCAGSKSKQVRLAIGSVLIVLALTSALVAQDIKITAEVDRTVVDLGESINLTVSLSGTVRSLPKPILPDLSDFEVYSSGTSSNFSIGIGSFVNQITYSYVLVPRKIGIITIQPAVVQYQGNTYSTEPIKIEVRQSTAQPPSPQKPQAKTQQPAGTRAGQDFFVEQSVDNSRPYVGQQVTLTFRFYQAQNLFQQPTLKWPDYSGFWIEDLPPNKSYTTTINGKVYRVTEIRRALFPTTPGRHVIDPAELVIPADAFGFFDSFFDDPFGMFGQRRRAPQREQVLRTSSLVLEVRQLPENGKPADFSGAVGRYSLSVSKDRDSVVVDQPVTLKASIAGVGNMKKLPQLELRQPENFRLYDSGSSENISKNDYLISGSKNFEWVLIPTAPGEYELPDISFSYFDPQQGKYITLNKKAGAVKVGRSAAIAENPLSIARNIIGTEKTGLNYIITELNESRPSKPLYGNSTFWYMQIFPIAWLTGLTIYSARKKRLENDQAFARRSYASKAARKALKSARESLNDPERFFSSIYTGVVGFVADKLNVSAAGLTTQAMLKLLTDTGKCGDLVSDLEKLVNACDSARYSPVKPEKKQMQEIYESAEKLLSRLDRSLN